MYSEILSRGWRGRDRGSEDFGGALGGDGQAGVGVEIDTKGDVVIGNDTSAVSVVV